MIQKVKSITKNIGINEETRKKYKEPPKEIPMVAMSEDGQYIVRLQPRQTSKIWKCVNPWASCHNLRFYNRETKEERALGMIALKDYEYFNYPTKEIKEQPSIEIEDKKNKQRKRYNYNDYCLAKAEYLYMCRKMRLKPKEEESQISWIKKVWGWLKGIFIKKQHGE